MSKFCPKCGNKLEYEDAEFCSNCGFKLKQDIKEEKATAEPSFNVKIDEDDEPVRVVSLKDLHLQVCDK